MRLSSFLAWPERGPALVSLALLVGATVVTPAQAATIGSSNPYAGRQGYDISYPQCGSGLIPGGQFAVVGVTGGKAFNDNACFAQQYDASLARVGAGNVSIYMNLNAAVGSTADNGLSGPYSASGTCKRGDKACQAYNYGWKAAQRALAKAGSRTANTWWLDIETANSWQAQTSLNRLTIQGAVDSLLNLPSPAGVQAGSTGVSEVGIYSVTSMWNKITGTWNSGSATPNGKPITERPVWHAGNSSTTCTSVASFTGGPLWLIQNASATTNGDQGCPA